MTLKYNYRDVRFKKGRIANMCHLINLSALPIPPLLENRTHPLFVLLWRGC